MMAGSGSGYGHGGGCHCSKKGGGGGLGDLGLLAAAGAAFFLLYQAITMAKGRSFSRRRRENNEFSSAFILDVLWKGRVLFVIIHISVSNDLCTIHMVGDRRDSSIFSHFPLSIIPI